MKLRNLLAMAMTAMILMSCGSENTATIGSQTAEADSTAIVLQTIMNRRSVRKYLDRAVENDKLAEIVKCGINAPSGMNKQPWVVRVVNDTAYINAVTKVYRKANADQVANDPNFKNMFRNAPSIIAVASPIDGSGQLDCGMLGENMMIAAQAMGLGTCCLGGPVRFLLSNEEAAPYVKMLDIPSDYRLLYILAVGYPDESPAAKSRDESKVRFIEMSR